MNLGAELQAAKARLLAARDRSGFGSKKRRRPDEGGEARPAARAVAPAATAPRGKVAAAAARPKQPAPAKKRARGSGPKDFDEIDDEPTAEELGESSDEGEVFQPSARGVGAAGGAAAVGDDDEAELKRSIASILAMHAPTVALGTAFALGAAAAADDDGRDGHAIVDDDAEDDAGGAADTSDREGRDEVAFDAGSDDDDERDDEEDDDEDDGADGEVASGAAAAQQPAKKKAHTTGALLGESAEQVADDDRCRCAYVTGLPTSASRTRVRQWLEATGAFVTDVRVVRRQGADESAKVAAYVDVHDVASLRKALAKHGAAFDGSRVAVRKFRSSAELQALVAASRPAPPGSARKAPPPAPEKTPEQRKQDKREKNKRYQQLWLKQHGVRGAGAEAHGSSAGAAAPSAGPPKQASGGKAGPDKGAAASAGGGKGPRDKARHGSRPASAPSHKTGAGPAPTAAGGASKQPKGLLSSSLSSQGPRPASAAQAKATRPAPPAGSAKRKTSGPKSARASSE